MDSLLTSIYLVLLRRTRLNSYLKAVIAHRPQRDAKRDVCNFAELPGKLRVGNYRNIKWILARAANSCKQRRVSSFYRLASPSSYNESFAEKVA